MLVIERMVGESIMVEDVQLRVEQIMGSTITFSMEKISGGQRTLVHGFKGQLINICYNVRATILSVNSQSTTLCFEASDEIEIRPLEPLD